MTTGASGFDPGNLWSPLKRYGLGLKERQWGCDYFCSSALIITVITISIMMYHPHVWLLCVFIYLSGAVSSSAAKLSVSHVFSPWTLKKAEQPEGGGSLDAILKDEEQEDHFTNTHGIITPVLSSAHTCMHTQNEIIISWYLLEGVYCGRVGSQGEGKLQHVHLHGAEQGTGFLYNQVIVGLICVCMGTTDIQGE